MISPVLLRSSVAVCAVVLASCRKCKPEPVVDLTPLGDAVRFLAVAIVLGFIVSSIFDLWGKD